MQEPLPPTEPTPAHSQAPKKGLAKTSMALGVLSATSILSLACLLWIDIFGVTIPDSRPAMKWLLGIMLSLGCCLGLLAGLPAIITGHVARHRARKAPEHYGGAGFAKAGIVMGYVSIFVAMIFAAIAIPSLLPARTHAQRNACIYNLRQIDAAKAQWALENRKKPGDPVVDEEVNAYLKNSQRPLCPAGGVYTYNPVGVNPTCSLGPVLGHTL
jgi:hypothetical protein